MSRKFNLFPAFYFVSLHILVRKLEEHTNSEGQSLSGQPIHNVRILQIGIVPEAAQSWRK